MNIYSALKRIEHFFCAKGPISVHSPSIFSLYTQIKCCNYVSNADIAQLKNVQNTFRKNHSKIAFKEKGSREGLISSRVSDVFIRTSKPLKQAMQIAQIAAIADGSTILELGTAFGTTTLTISIAAPKSKIITIEGVEEIAKYAKDNFEKQNAKNINFKIGNFIDVLPNVIKEYNNIGFVFIDGHHSKQPTINLINMLLPSLSKKSIVLIDDIYYSKEMSYCWRELISNDFFQVKIDFYHFGLLIRDDNLSKENYRLRL